MFRMPVRQQLLAPMFILVCVPLVRAQQPAPTALIQGRVVAANTGAALKGAHVSLVKDRPSRDEIKSTDGAPAYHATTGGSR